MSDEPRKSFTLTPAQLVIAVMRYAYQEKIIDQAHTAFHAASITVGNDEDVAAVVKYRPGLPPTPEAKP